MMSSALRTSAASLVRMTPVCRSYGLVAATDLRHPFGSSHRILAAGVRSNRPFSSSASLFAETSPAGSAGSGQARKPWSTRSKIYLAGTASLLVYGLVVWQKEELVTRVKLSKRVEESLVSRLQLADRVRTTRELRRELQWLHLLFSALADDKNRIPVEQLRSTSFVLIAEPTGTIDLAAVFDRDSSGYVDFKEFVYGVCMMRRFREVNPEDKADLARFEKLMFALVDFEQNGVITPAELVAWLGAARALSLVPANLLEGSPTNEELADRLLREFDADGDGKLCFSEWQALHGSLDWAHYTKLA